MSMLQLKHAQNNSALLDLKNKQMVEESERVKQELASVRDKLEKAMKDKETELQSRLALEHDKAKVARKAVQPEERAQEYDIEFEHFRRFTFAQFERERGTLVTAHKKKLPVLIEQITQYQTWQVLVEDHLKRFEVDLQERVLATKDRKTHLTKMERNFKALKLDEAYLKGLKIAQTQSQVEKKTSQVLSALDSPKTVKIHLG